MLGNWARKDFGEKKFRSARFRAEPKGVPKMAKSEKKHVRRVILADFGSVWTSNVIFTHKKTCQLTQY